MPLHGAWGSWPSPVPAAVLRKVNLALHLGSTVECCGVGSQPWHCKHGRQVPITHLSCGSKSGEAIPPSSPPPPINGAVPAPYQLQPGESGPYTCLNIYGEPNAGSPPSCLPALEGIPGWSPRQNRTDSFLSVVHYKQVRRHLEVGANRLYAWRFPSIYVNDTGGWAPRLTSQHRPVPSLFCPRLFHSSSELPRTKPRSVPWSWGCHSSYSSREAVWEETAL